MAAPAHRLDAVVNDEKWALLLVKTGAVIEDDDIAALVGKDYGINTFQVVFAEAVTSDADAILLVKAENREKLGGGIQEIMAMPLADAAANDPPHAVIDYPLDAPNTSPVPFDAIKARRKDGSIGAWIRVKTKHTHTRHRKEAADQILTALKGKLQERLLFAATMINRDRLLIRIQVHDGLELQRTLGQIRATANVEGTRTHVVLHYELPDGGDKLVQREVLGYLWLQSRRVDGWTPQSHVQTFLELFADKFGRARGATGSKPTASEAVNALASKKWLNTRGGAVQARTTPVEVQLSESGRAAAEALFEFSPKERRLKEQIQEVTGAM